MNMLPMAPGAKKYKQLPPHSMPPTISPTTRGALIFSKSVPKTYSPVKSKASAIRVMMISCSDNVSKRIYIYPFLIKVDCFVQSTLTIAALRDFL